MKYRVYLLLMLAVTALLLAACSSAAEETPADQEPVVESGTAAEMASEPAEEPASDQVAAPTTEPTPEPTAEPTTAPTAEQAATTDPATAGAPASIPTAELSELPPGFIPFSAEEFTMELAHPVTWRVQEEPGFGVTVESRPDVLDDFPNINGAALIAYERDELAIEDVVEALRLSIFALGPPPETIFIERPTVSIFGDQEVATAFYDERGSGQVGFYVFVKNGDRGVFIFSVASGPNKDALMDILDAIIGTVSLAETLTS